MGITLYGKTLGKRLRELRESRAWSQSDVCDRVGMGQNNYSNYECDRITRPTPSIVKKLADLYDVPIDVLMHSENALDHLPPKVVDMLQHQDSVPFLLNALEQWQLYRNARDSE